LRRLLAAPGVIATVYAHYALVGIHDESAETLFLELAAENIFSAFSLYTFAQ